MLHFILEERFVFAYKGKREIQCIGIIPQSRWQLYKVKEAIRRGLVLTLQLHKAGEGGLTLPPEFPEAI